MSSAATSAVERVEQESRHYIKRKDMNIVLGVTNATAEKRSDSRTIFRIAKVLVD